MVGSREWWGPGVVRGGGGPGGGLGRGGGGPGMGGWVVRRVVGPGVVRFGGGPGGGWVGVVGF